MKRDENDPAARYWLGKTFLAAGLLGHARIELTRFIKQFPGHPKAKEVQALLDTSAPSKADSEEATDT